MNDEMKPIEIRSILKPKGQLEHSQPSIVAILETSIDFFFWDGRDWCPLKLATRHPISKGMLDAIMMIEETEKRNCWRMLHEIIENGYATLTDKFGKQCKKKVLAIASIPFYFESPINSIKEPKEPSTPLDYSSFTIEELIVLQHKLREHPEDINHVDACLDELKRRSLEVPK